MRSERPGGPVGWVYLAMGAADCSDATWTHSDEVRSVVRWRGAAPSGRRLNRRSLGLGADSLMLAVLAMVRTRGRGPFLAANPWTGVALRLLGRRDIAVTGIYAKPGSRSFRLLSAILRHAVVVTTSEVEAEEWNRFGGRARAVRYGNTFQYPERTSGAHMQVFVGGTSDRNPQLIERLVDELGDSSKAVDLVLCDGLPAGERQVGNVRVRRPGYLSQASFGDALAGSDVVVLPLSDEGRSAGHMVLVGALEAGVPVLTVPVRGIREYIDGGWVRAIDVDRGLLEQVEAHGRDGQGSAAAIREYWRGAYSLECYVDRVLSALRGGPR